MKRLGILTIIAAFIGMGATSCSNSRATSNGMGIKFANQKHSKMGGGHSSCQGMKTNNKW